MADHCPHCGAANPENLPFCNACGEPNDQNLKIIMDVQQATKAHQETVRSSRYDDDDDFLEEEDEEIEEKKFPVGILIILVAAVAIGLWFFLK